MCGLSRKVVPNYLKEFPIPENQLPQRLRLLLDPVSIDPTLRVSVAEQYEHDAGKDDEEIVQMQMILKPEDRLSSLTTGDCPNQGIVCRGAVYTGSHGSLRSRYSVSGLDYLVAVWGDHTHFGFNLSENVWMALNLTPRCIGNDDQKIVYDALSRQESGVAEGQVSMEYLFGRDHNVRWVMKNEYLRRYLWLRDRYAVRAFYYRKRFPDTQEIRDLMGGAKSHEIYPEDSWYRIDIREMNGRILVQVWSVVIAVPPELCPERSAERLDWPGIKCVVTPDWARHYGRDVQVYLDDEFLERYEQSEHIDSMPRRSPMGGWSCGPQFKQLWDFSNLRRVGRNMLRISIHDLYQVPSREILHAREYALSSARVAERDETKEHIVRYVERLIDELLLLGDNLARMSCSLGIPCSATDLIDLSRSEWDASCSLMWPDVEKLAHIAPLNMREDEFLSRCKRIHALLERIIKVRPLRQILKKRGHKRSKFKELRSLKLLQALSNIVERLNADGHTMEDFVNKPKAGELERMNSALAVLFINFDLRIQDAHVGREAKVIVQRLGVDTAILQDGYGLALDAVFDGVIDAFTHVNSELDKLLRM